MAWKRGVKIQAMVLTGSAPGTAGQRLGRCVGRGTSVGLGASPARVGAGLGVGACVGLGHGAAVLRRPARSSAGRPMARRTDRARAGRHGRQPEEQDEGDGQDGNEAELDAPIGGHEVSVILPWRTQGSADRVIAAGREGVAARDPLGTHPASLEQPVALDGLLGVSRAAGLVSTRRGAQANSDAIHVDQADTEPLHPSVLSSCSAPPFRRRRSNVAARSAWLAVVLAPRATSRMSKPGAVRGPMALRPSRTRRRIRLRTTAPPSRRLVEIRT